MAFSSPCPALNCPTSPWLLGLFSSGGCFAALMLGLLPILWSVRMLCRGVIRRILCRCVIDSGGCFATVSLILADVLPPSLLVPADAWPQL